MRQPFLRQLDSHFCDPLYSVFIIWDFRQICICLNWTRLYSAQLRHMQICWWCHTVDFWTHFCFNYSLTQTATTLQTTCNIIKARSSNYLIYTCELCKKVILPRSCQKTYNKFAYEQCTGVHMRGSARSHYDLHMDLSSDHFNSSLQAKTHTKTVILSVLFFLFDTPCTEMRHTSTQTNQHCAQFQKAQLTPYKTMYSFFFPFTSRPTKLHPNTYKPTPCHFP